MSDKQQLAAMGAHMAQQPLCMAKRVEELEAQVRVMTGLLREAVAWMDDHPAMPDSSMMHDALAGKLPAPAVTVTETIRTAPARIWLQVGDQSHYHSEPFPRDTGEVTWCADPVVGCEVPYVRADLVGQFPVLTMRGFSVGKTTSITLPEGWQLVPVTVTPEMDNAAMLSSGGGNIWWGLQPVWNAALAAAPKPEAK